ncbi:UDP-N-acetylmuramate dehydrogenase [Cyclobacterium qasimii]|uniref:UDP-N-acetylenolpyruvoylglucosamine reductase n=2 Tax=Cyclobacterium qasimii TaxID=1350429 RepID=S7VGL7_9BACT|nr:UDP-N-acetylmuramate dehydrogenase [Cyclobacterium qasimii]EPR69360.1 UDP-N-acetylenolpyruvoylglucosamine reductase [Cyclobacterium qasimii M12-11B]GEO22848.1 UDP-N-acetylenolpyruvoylglucosamine reductase [Cyclobacterium qasimii]
MKIQENISLKAYNTFGIDVNASFFAEVRSKDDILEALKFAKTKKVPILILGGGSNVLFTEELYALVLKINITGIKEIKSDDKTVLIEVGSGVIWHEFVLYSLEKGLSGIENLSLIPGTVGAAPMQNIGAYGVEIKAVFQSLEAIEISTGLTKTFLASEVKFGYRESVFKTSLKGKYIIYKVSFNLSKVHAPNISYGDIQTVLDQMDQATATAKNISKAIISIRQSKLPDPKVIGNAGSFFKNPVIPVDVFDNLKLKFPTLPGYPNATHVKVPAAWLIENAGWKGKQVGEVGVHKRQPLVLVNYGNGKGEEILALSRQIQTEVHAKFGISLEREVNVVNSKNLIQV